MKVLLTTLNAKYIHSSLALRYLKEYCQSKKYQLDIKEFTINDYLENIVADIYKSKAEVVAFSCYIWNIKQILMIIDRLKKVSPDLKIILGGPEVSFGSIRLMEENAGVDYIIRGEGEKPLKNLLDFLSGTSQKLMDINEISGLIYRDGKNILESNDLYSICDVDLIPRPYNAEQLSNLSNKIIYYEAARGCPFNCSYCLSSTTNGIRFFPLSRVKKDLMLFIENDVELVKFVDRTFNADKKRAMGIFNFLVKNKKNTSFHFELAADLLDLEMIDFLNNVPEGLFQFEIGVQSTNFKTIKAIDRKMDLSKLTRNVLALRKTNNINLHLDLIAGLPEENYSSFEKSFNDVYQMSPHVLQLGFLKLLKGSKIRDEAEVYDYKFLSEPPYEVLQNNVLSFRDILRLKEIEFVLNRYYNSGVFQKTLNFIIHNFYESPFKFFEKLSVFFEEENLNRISHSRKTLYDLLFEFYEKNIKSALDIFVQYLKFDLLLNNKGVKLPYWTKKMKSDSFKDQRYQFLEDRQNIAKYLPRFENSSVRKVLRQVAFGVFTFDILKSSPLKVKEGMKNKQQDQKLKNQKLCKFNPEQSKQQKRNQQKIVILFDYQKTKAFDVTTDFEFSKYNL